MKTSIFVPLLILFLAVNLYPQETAPQTTEPPTNTLEKELMVPYSPFSLHKMNYIVFGNPDDQVKAQFGFKYEVFKESELFLAYSQSIFWDLYSTSSPILEVNLSPELFWNYGDNAHYVRLGFYEHKSNGRDGPTSRAWDRSYVQFQTSFGDSVNVGANVKGFYMWKIADENHDIEDYTGYYEAEIFLRFLKPGPLRLTDKEEIYIRGGTGKGNYGFDYTKGWLEAGVKFRMVFKTIQPDLFIQLFYGYGESLVAYNKEDFTVRAGFILR